MIAMAMVAFFAAVSPAQEVIENLESEKSEVVLYEDSDEGEEVAINEENERSDQIVFEDENDELPEDLVACDDEE